MTGSFSGDTGTFDGTDTFGGRPVLVRFLWSGVTISVAQRSARVLTVAAPGAPPFELRAGRGLRFEVPGQPGITVEFELGETGAVARLVAQPLGIFLPKT